VTASFSVTPFKSISYTLHALPTEVSRIIHRRVQGEWRSQRRCPGARKGRRVNSENDYVFLCVLCVPCGEVLLTLPLHLYVHIPFCLHKCPYCDFNSHVRPSPPWDVYQQALLRELAYWSVQPQYAGRPIQTIFFGGGTPSLAPPSLIRAIIETAERLLALEPATEITLEANPGTVEAERFADYHQAGINRLSIGVQSFNDKELKWLERIHSGREAIAAYDMARNAGFKQINLDLMYGLPDQTIET